MVYPKGTPLPAPASPKTSPAGKTRKGFKCIDQKCNIHIDTSDGMYPCLHFGPWPTEESPGFVCAQCVLDCCGGTKNPTIADKHLEVWLKVFRDFANFYPTPNYKHPRKMRVKHRIQCLEEIAERRLVLKQLDGSKLDARVKAVMCSDPVREAMFHGNKGRKTARQLYIEDEDVSFRRAVNAVARVLADHGMASPDQVDKAVRAADRKLSAARSKLVARRLEYAAKDYSKCGNLANHTKKKHAAMIARMEAELPALQEEYEELRSVQKKVDNLMVVFDGFFDGWDY